MSRSRFKVPDSEGGGGGGKPLSPVSLCLSVCLRQRRQLSLEANGGLTTTTETTTDRMLEVGIKERRTNEAAKQRGSKELYEAKKEREGEREREPLRRKAPK